MNTPIFLKHPWRHDPRSKAFSHSRFFGSVSPFLLPPTLNRTRRPIENQGVTLRCAAYAGAVNGSYIHGRRFSPEWQTKRISQLEGRAVDIQGSDPNAAMASQTFLKGGYLPYEDSPVTLENDGIQKSGDPASFPAALDAEASNWGVEAYVKPDGGPDIFDSICIALYMAYDHEKQTGACVQAFSGWYDTFNAPLITNIETLLGYHSYLFIDFEEYQGQRVLIMQNSYGDGIWDNGFQRMTRPVVNQLFAKWGTSLKIPKPLTLEQIAEARKETPTGRIWRQILAIWYFISEHYFNV